MDIALTQYIFDVLIIISIIGIIYGIKKKSKYFTVFLILWLLTLTIASLTVYFNFTNSSKVIKMESNKASYIFQSKMKEPEKKIQEFNYSKDFKSESKDITNEADKIHKNIKDEK